MDEKRVSNEQIDKKLESFVEIMIQKMMDLHSEVKDLKKKVGELEMARSEQLRRV